MENGDAGVHGTQGTHEYSTCSASKASAKEVFLQAERTRKLLQKQGSSEVQLFNALAKFKLHQVTKYITQLLEFRTNFLQGVYDDKINEFASRHGSKKSRNFSRVLHGMIHRKDKTLPVQVDAVLSKVRIPRKKSDPQTLASDLLV